MKHLGQIETPRYAATFSTALHPDLGRDAKTDAAMRACIDLPALVRTHGLRMIVSAGAVAFAATGETRASARDVLKSAREGYRIVAACFGPDGERLGLHPAVIDLITRIAAHHGEAMDLTHRFPDYVDRLMTGIDNDDVRSEYDDLMQFTYERYVPRLMEMEAAIRSAVGAYRAAETAAADAARQRTQGARHQIGSIAKTVRLISLNAHVEAARAGEAGKAFAVIASEIRALSERTEVAVGEMEASIDAILDHARRR